MPSTHRSFRFCWILGAMALGALVVAQAATAAAQTTVPHGAGLFGPNGAPSSTPQTKSPAANYIEMPVAGEMDHGTTEGIKVHGHWKIDVKNPDGKLVESREFENALSTNAALYLVGAMSGYMNIGDWMIVLGASSGNAPCTAQYQFCGIVRSLATQPAINYCGSYYCSGSTLTYTYSFGTNNQGPYSMVFSGQITANQTGSVGTVYTLPNACANVSYNATPSSPETSSPATCVTTTSGTYVGPFTNTTLGTPVAVTSGQIIQVTVTITFS